MLGVRGGPGHYVGSRIGRSNQLVSHTRCFDSDNGPEFIAEAIRDLGKQTGLEMLYIQPASPWENGFAESFFSRLRDELLNVEEFMNLAEARWFAKRRLHEHNEERPHSSLGYQTPSEFASQCAGRVDPGDRSPRPLTEPDLRVTHPALQVAALGFKQSLLLDQDLSGRVQGVPTVGERRQAFGKPGVEIRLMDTIADTASPNASTGEGGLSRRLPRNTTCLQVSKQIPIPLLLTNDNRPNTTPNVGVELVKRA